MDEDILVTILFYFSLLISASIHFLFDLIFSYTFLYVPFTILFGCGAIIFVYKLLKR